MKILGNLNQTKKQPIRRSERRLGLNVATMESNVSSSPLAIKPVIIYWQVYYPRVLSGMLCLLCIWIIYLLFHFDTFYITNATIIGNNVLTNQEIYAASQINGNSVFVIAPSMVKANIEALPNVKTAHIQLDMPANIIIQVEERQPEVLWRTGDRLWWIDEEGTFVPPRIAQRTEEAQKERLLIIDMDETSVRANDQIDYTIIQAAQVVHGHKPETKEMFYSNEHGLIFTTEEGWRVYLGNGNNIHSKVFYADMTIHDLLSRNITPDFIDVRNPWRVVYKEKLE